MLEKRQKNEPVTERDSTAEIEADTQRGIERALNLPERGEATCTKVKRSPCIPTGGESNNNGGIRMMIYQRCHPSPEGIVTAHVVISQHRPPRCSGRIQITSTVQNSSRCQFAGFGGHFGSFDLSLNSHC